MRAEYMQIHIQEKSFQIREKRNVLYYIERMVKPIRRWLERGNVIATGGRQNNGTLEDIHALTSIPYKYGPLHDKADFVDVTETVDLKVER